MSESLDDQIGRYRSDIRTNQWSISIGEIFSLYERGQLEINPAFQRFFRWSDSQKSYLVESILLGLPIPPLFLAQSSDGRLEVVDGVQRLSTLLQLRGLLRVPEELGEEGLRPPLLMTTGQYLAGLEGVLWSDELVSDVENPSALRGTFTEAQRSDILFAKLDATVIQRTSSGQAKYDVFRRLNSYGEPLTPQEMRAALIASVNGDCLAWLSALARTDEIAELLSLSDRQIERQYDVELVLRFFFLVETDDLRASELRDFPGVLDRYGLALADEYPSRRTERLGAAWSDSMRDIIGSAGGDFFRRYYPSEERFKGAFLNTSFEALGSAVGYHHYRGAAVEPDLAEVAQELWRQEVMTTRFATGLSTEARLARYVPMGRELVKA